MKHRAPAYWPTRILLGVGFVATVIALALTLTLPYPIGGSFSDSRVSVLGLPVSFVIPLVVLVLAFVGVGWMVRIFRGSRDEAPVWRYRDR